MDLGNQLCDIFMLVHRQSFLPGKNFMLTLVQSHMGQRMRCLLCSSSCTVLNES